MALRKFVLLLVPLFCAYAAVPKELQALADQARALPPEFSADVLLKLAASPLANDPKWKRGLIEDAFLGAAHAQSPYRMRGDTRVAAGDVSSGHLEALMLQTRAVEAMLALDPQRALTMLQDVPKPDLPKLSCQHALTPDVSAYYQTASALFSGAFTAVQRRKGDDIQFLRQLVAATESPSQVVPALKLVDQVELSPQNRTELIALFAVALDRLNGGDREFSASESLLVTAAVPEVHETFFLPALRAYIVRHVSGPRCSDQIAAGQSPESVTEFNKLISRIDPSGTQFHPIGAKEAEPLKDDGTYSQTEMGQSPHAQQMLRTVLALGHAVRSSKEWTAQYYEALKLIESWQPEEEASEEDYSFMCAVYYANLLDVVVDGPVHQNALSSALHFLEQQYGSLENRGLWFQEFRQLFSSFRLSSANPDQAWLLDQLVHSRNSVISVYAQIEKLLRKS
jgi:hypothetical protein